MEILLIRHGKTAGNLERRYVGRTDEPIIIEEMETLAKKEDLRKVAFDQIFSSKMLRCRQTAEAIFQTEDIVVWPGLEETDFGEFEYKNYEELKDDPRYQAWIDGGGIGAFPGGESGMEFRARCKDAFSALVEDAYAKELKNIVIVAHGGTIMSIMEAFVEPKKSFYEWQPKNGCGFRIAQPNQKADHWELVSAIE